MDQVRALKIVLQMAKEFADNGIIEIPEAKDDSHADKLQESALRIVAALVNEVEVNAKDPVGHGLDFLRSHGAVPALIVHASEIEKQLREQHDIDPGEISVTVIRYALDMAIDKEWESMLPGARSSILGRATRIARKQSQTKQTLPA